MHASRGCKPVSATAASRGLLNGPRLAFTRDGCDDFAWRGVGIAELAQQLLPLRDIRCQFWQTREFSIMRKMLLTAAAAAFALVAGTASAQTLRIGLNEDIDTLDPTLGTTFVGRIVFASICDKLFDLDDKLNIVPQLATAYEWGGDSKSLLIKIRSGVKFHDGEPMDAAAVKFSLDRHKSMDGSRRRTELAQVNSVEVVDPTTIKVNLSTPFSPLLAVLADRAGMIVSPKAVQTMGARFTTAPVCAGPFKFVERVAQDRIVVDRFADYWDKGNIHFDRVVYLPIVDASVRLANLRSGQLDFIERMQASDVPGLRNDSRFKMSKIVEIGYQGITINVGKGQRPQNNPLGKDARVREAFELSLDRKAIIDVLMEGEGQSGNQWVSPDNPFYAKNVPMPTRDIDKAKALLRAAGVTNPSFTLMTGNSTDAQKAAQIIQAMARDAGFDVKIQATEFATLLSEADKGNYDATVLNWSGRPDPDGNVQQFYTCGAPNNYAGYCIKEIDELVEKSRTSLNPAERLKYYEQIAAATVGRDRPIIYLFHRNWLWAYASKVSGLRAVPDGLVRVQGLKFN
jgi:peptide/nickel transport system substrate-binding protein